MHRIVLAIPILAGSALFAQRTLYTLKTSSVEFISDAPMERITASNASANGILDIKDRDFVVRVPMRGFKGFNSPLQQEHFHENYVDSKEHPNALFEGRIIEAVDLTAHRTYKVRAKGRFTVHGIARERNIQCDIVVSPSGLRVRGDLDVPLADHGIRIPRVVQQKLAAVVKVKVDLYFEPPAKK